LKQQSLIDSTLHLADNALVLSQRNAEWCGHGPILEQDIAITNISLDLLGQSRNFYQYAAALINASEVGVNNTATEDTLAYLRKERDFKNCLLVEQPKGDWAYTILRQFLFSNYQYLLYKELENHADQQLAAIAVKSLKEVTYHLRWSSEWVIRLGDGTEESRERINNAIESCWPYCGELFIPAPYETTSGINIAALQASWMDKVNEVFSEATLIVPEKVFMHTGGKQGIHTEHMGFLLAELQYMQRAYPGANW
jgi:ring-1,2-phenylacetyl-CoA epoxidase subunit PaaC